MLGKKYLILKHKLKSVLREYAYEKSDLENFIGGCIMEATPLNTFRADLFDFAGNPQDIIMGKVIMTDHPMPYFNVPVQIPKKALMEIPN